MRNYEEAYITNPTGENDILIYGIRDRNRSFHGDVVAVTVKPRHHWAVRENAYIAYKKKHEQRIKNTVDTNPTESSDAPQSDLQPAVTVAPVVIAVSDQEEDQDSSADAGPAGARFYCPFVTVVSVGDALV